MAVLRVAVRIAGVPVLGLGLGLLAAQLVTQLTPPTYEASAALVVSARAGGGPDGQETASITLTQSLVPTIARVVESHEVAASAAERLDMPADAVVGQVTGRFEPGLQIINVAATAGSARAAAAVANAAADAVIRRLSDFPVAEGVRIDARVLDRAVPPGQPVLPKPALNLAFGALAGLLAGLGLATTRGRFDDRLRDPQAVEAELGLPVLAVFPQLPRDVRRRRLRVLRRTTVDVAADTLVAGLGVFVEALSGRRVMVTSARGDDGKALVAALLAVRMADCHDRVTLVENGLRQPTRTGPPPTADRIVLSLLDGVAGSSHDAFATPTVVGADLVARRTADGADGTVDDLLDEITGRGDDVVVHAPAVLAGAAAVTLARRVDAVLLVVRRGVTTTADAKQAALLMRHLGVPFVGVVVVDGVRALPRRPADRQTEVGRRRADPRGAGGDHRRRPDSLGTSPGARTAVTTTAPRVPGRRS
ncbi:hypothetical protein ACN27F_20090 [Solwaraspora sp. WMMB335]|uniref:hypothetical protein n=1 Tax=Solwaraspora sp. WMMB335 TaxID=3404118 RepID=UPI003B944DF4